MCPDRNPFSPAEAGSLGKSDSLLSHEQRDSHIENTQLCSALEILTSS